MITLKDLPHVFSKTIQVFVTEARRGGETTATSDGRPIHDPLETDGFTLTTINSGIMTREHGKDTLLLEWVDQSGVGHRFRVPHKVIDAIVKGRKTLVAKSRSAGATQAGAKRAADGVIPFQKQKAEESN